MGTDIRLGGWSVQRLILRGDWRATLTQSQGPVPAPFLIDCTKNLQTVYGLRAVATTMMVIR